MLKKQLGEGKVRIVLPRNNLAIFPYYEHHAFGRFLWMMPALPPCPPFHNYNLRWRTSDRPALNLEILIAEYTSRQLSFPSDALNAFLGILTHHDNALQAHYYDAPRGSGSEPRLASASQAEETTLASLGAAHSERPSNSPVESARWR